MGEQFIKNQKLTSRARGAVVDEFVAQINYVRDLGIEVRHIDSHHNFHYSKVMLPVLREVIDKTGIKKIRRKPNFNYLWKAKTASYIWKTIVENSSNIVMTDYFGCVYDYLKYTNAGKGFKDNTVIELMCHPGITKGFHIEENEFLQSWDYSSYKLITYNDL